MIFKSKTKTHLKHTNGSCVRCLHNKKAHSDAKNGIDISYLVGLFNYFVYSLHTIELDGVHKYRLGMKNNKIGDCKCIPPTKLYIEDPDYQESVCKKRNIDCNESRKGNMAIYNYTPNKRAKISVNLRKCRFFNKKSKNFPNIYPVQSNSSRTMSQEWPYQLKEDIACNCFEDLNVSEDPSNNVFDDDIERNENNPNVLREFDQNETSFKEDGKNVFNVTHKSCIRKEYSYINCGNCNYGIRRSTKKRQTKRVSFKDCESPETSMTKPDYSHDQIGHSEELNNVSPCTDMNVFEFFSIEQQNTALNCRKKQRTHSKTLQRKFGSYDFGSVGVNTTRMVNDSNFTDKDVSNSLDREQYIKEYSCEQFKDKVGDFEKNHNTPKLRTFRNTFINNKATPGERPYVSKKDKDFRYHPKVLSQNKQLPKEDECKKNRPYLPLPCYRKYTYRELPCGNNFDNSNYRFFQTGKLPNEEKQSPNRHESHYQMSTGEDVCKLYRNVADEVVKDENSELRKYNNRGMRFLEPYQRKPKINNKRIVGESNLPVSDTFKLFDNEQRNKLTDFCKDVKIQALDCEIFGCTDIQTIRKENVNESITPSILSNNEQYDSEESFCEEIYNKNCDYEETYNKDKQSLYLKSLNIKSDIFESGDTEPNLTQKDDKSNFASKLMSKKFHNKSHTFEKVQNENCDSEKIFNSENKLIRPETSQKKCKRYEAGDTLTNRGKKINELDCASKYDKKQQNTSQHFCQDLQSKDCKGKKGFNGGKQPTDPEPLERNSENYETDDNKSGFADTYLSKYSCQGVQSRDYNFEKEFTKGNQPTYPEIFERKSANYEPGDRQKIKDSGFVVKLYRIFSNEQCGRAKSPVQEVQSKDCDFDKHFNNNNQPTCSESSQRKTDNCEPADTQINKIQKKNKGRKILCKSFGDDQRNYTEDLWQEVQSEDYDLENQFNWNNQPTCPESSQRNLKKNKCKSFDNERQNTAEYSLRKAQNDNNIFVNQGKQYENFEQFQKKLKICSLNNTEANIKKKVNKSSFTGDDMCRLLFSKKKPITANSFDQEVKNQDCHDRGIQWTSSKLTQRKLDKPKYTELDYNGRKIFKCLDEYPQRNHENVDSYDSRTNKMDDKNQVKVKSLNAHLKPRLEYSPNKTVPTTQNESYILKPNESCEIQENSTEKNVSISNDRKQKMREECNVALSDQIIMSKERCEIDGYIYGKGDIQSRNIKPTIDLNKEEYLCTQCRSCIRENPFLPDHTNCDIIKKINNKKNKCKQVGQRLDDDRDKKEVCNRKSEFCKGSNYETVSNSQSFINVNDETTVKKVAETSKSHQGMFLPYDQPSDSKYERYQDKIHKHISHLENDDTINKPPYYKNNHSKKQIVIDQSEISQHCKDNKNIYGDQQSISKLQKNSSTCGSVLVKDSLYVTSKRLNVDISKETFTHAYLHTNQNIELSDDDNDIYNCDLITIKSVKSESQESVVKSTKNINKSQPELPVSTINDKDIPEDYYVIQYNKLNITRMPHTKTRRYVGEVKSETSLNHGYNYYFKPCTYSNLSENVEKSNPNYTKMISKEFFVDKSNFINIDNKEYDRYYQRKIYEDLKNKIENKQDVIRQNNMGSECDYNLHRDQRSLSQHKQMSPSEKDERIPINYKNNQSKSSFVNYHSKTNKNKVQKNVSTHRGTQVKGSLHVTLKRFHVDNAHNEHFADAYLKTDKDIKLNHKKNSNNSVETHYLKNNVNKFQNSIESQLEISVTPESPRNIQEDCYMDMRPRCNYWYQQCSNLAKNIEEFDPKKLEIDKNNFHSDFEYEEGNSDGCCQFECPRHLTNLVSNKSLQSKHSEISHKCIVPDLPTKPQNGNSHHCFQSLITITNEPNENTFCDCDKKNRFSQLPKNRVSILSKKTQTKKNYMNSDEYNNVKRNHMFLTRNCDTPMQPRISHIVKNPKHLENIRCDYVQQNLMSFISNSCMSTESQIRESSVSSDYNICYDNTQIGDICMTVNDNLYVEQNRVPVAPKRLMSTPIRTSQVGETYSSVNYKVKQNRWSLVPKRWMSTPTKNQKSVQRTKSRIAKSRINVNDYTYQTSQIFQTSQDRMADQSIKCLGKSCSNIQQSWPSSWSTTSSQMNVQAKLKINVERGINVGKSFVDMQQAKRQILKSSNSGNSYIDIQPILTNGKSGILNNNCTVVNDVYQGYVKQSLSNIQPIKYQFSKGELFKPQMTVKDVQTGDFDKELKYTKTNTLNPYIKSENIVKEHEFCNFCESENSNFLSLPYNLLLTDEHYYRENVKNISKSRHSNSKKIHFKNIMSKSWRAAIKSKFSRTTHLRKKKVKNKKISNASNNSTDRWYYCCVSNESDTFNKFDYCAGVLSRNSKLTSETNVMQVKSTQNNCNEMNTISTLNTNANEADDIPKLTVDCEVISVWTNLKPFLSKSDYTLNSTKHKYAIEKRIAETQTYITKYIREKRTKRRQRKQRNKT